MMDRNNDENEMGCCCGIFNLYAYIYVGLTNAFRQNIILSVVVHSHLALIELKSKENEANQKIQYQMRSCKLDGRR